MCTPFFSRALIIAITLISCSVSAAVGAEERQTLIVDIPAKPLNSALNQLAQSAAIVLSFDPAVTRDKTSQAIRGNYTFEQALNLLLQGSNLIAIKQSNGGYAIQAANGDVIMLDPVHVTGRRETAFGAVDGYVARRSATGTKTDTPILETPQSISVVTRDEMDVRDIRDIGEALAYTAGAFTGGNGETALFGGNSIKVRGFGGGGTAGTSFNEYLDGMKLHAAAYVSANLDPYLFERVEVLKGPASVLFGQTQPGGIVNMVSKLPTADNVNQIRLGTGNRNRFDAAFDVGGTLNDKVLFRVVGIELEGDTQQDHSDRERRMLAPSLSWKNGGTSLTILSHYQHDDLDASVLNVVPRDGLVSNPNGRVPLNFRVGDPGFEFWDRETWSLGYLLSHEFTDAVTVRQNLRYTKNELDSNWLYRRNLDSDRRTLNRWAMHAEESAKNLTLDNQLEWKLSTGRVEHTLLSGIDYQRFSGKSSAFGDAAPSIDLFNPVYYQTIPTPSTAWWDDRQTIRQLGVYAQDQIKIGALSLLIGGRYDEAKVSMRDMLAAEPDTETERDHDFTGRIGVIYNFENGFAPYASYSESFEPVSGRAFDRSRFEPMKGRQYEAGVKYQPPGGNHMLTLAAFELTQENMTTSDPDNPGWSIQIGEVRTRGIELEGKANFTTGLDVVAAYTYLDDEVTESNDDDLGKRRAQVPEHSASLWANYTMFNGPLRGWKLGLGVRHIGKTQGDSENTFDVSGYTLVDLALSHDLGDSPLGLKGWKASVNVNNLLDKDYIASCSATHSCYLGVSRAVRATLTYDW